jgi:hypothetical protein
MWPHLMNRNVMAFEVDEIVSSLSAPLAFKRLSTSFKGSKSF